MHFKDKVIWITGASSGIGAELAKQFASQKAKLILTARNLEALTRIKEECAKQTSCEILQADLQSSDIETLCQQAIITFGHIDIVINNAGVSQRSFAVDTSMEVYRNLMEINFFAPIRITQALLPHFQERKRGHIVALSSIAGLMGFPLRTGYSAAKHAIHGYFESLQVEHQIPNFNVTIISPGRINTPISKSALTGDSSPHNQMDKGQLNGIPVEKCAALIINSIQKKRKHTIIAKEERILWWFWRFIPSLYYSFARKSGISK